MRKFFSFKLFGASVVVFPPREAIWFLKAINELYAHNRNVCACEWCRFYRSL